MLYFVIFQRSLRL